MCRCRSIEYKKEQEESKKRECMEYIARLRSSGLHDKALRDYTFENDKGYNPEMEKAHKYVEQWDKMKAMSAGLLIWGNVGTGKSFAAGCIANALIDKNIEEEALPQLIETVSIDDDALTLTLRETKAKWVISQSNVKEDIYSAYDEYVALSYPDRFGAVID